MVFVPTSMSSVCDITHQGYRRLTITTINIHVLKLFLKITQIFEDLNYQPHT